MKRRYVRRVHMRVGLRRPAHSSITPYAFLCTGAPWHELLNTDNPDLVTCKTCLAEMARRKADPVRFDRERWDATLRAVAVACEGLAS